MMRSGGTMKVSLTPDRLKSMEVRSGVYFLTAGVEVVARCITRRRASVQLEKAFRKQTRGAR
jgi:hypothetical protein